jgi:hypothetical protein
MPHLNFGHLLTDLFLYVLYPATVLAVFLGLIVMLILAIWGGNWSRGTYRRATGALLPLVVLVILVATDSAAIQSWAARVSGIRPLIQLLIGAIVGLALMELGRQLRRSGSVGANAVFAMFVSALLAFLLWSVMGGVLAHLHLLLLGFLVACGLHLIFRGLSEDASKNRPATTAS